MWWIHLYQSLVLAPRRSCCCGIRRRSNSNKGLSHPCQNHRKQNQTMRRLRG
ncbi:hypothetical protein THIOM_000956 [Candidatus Thiomargarita nelsonii]|uniref:Uncharacterized protein n=1 Tax=Candidatus Thiomargarita nelsonii TaxID=1003181 RepID=A0A176S5P5_9GAMM|nr:hypothetical protein THIOM_000956 [Candidatus Thiomargarita nelsonii]